MMLNELNALIADFPDVPIRPEAATEAWDYRYQISDLSNEQRPADSMVKGMLSKVEIIMKRRHYTELELLPVKSAYSKNQRAWCHMLTVLMR